MDRRGNSDQLYIPVDLETPDEPSAGMATPTCFYNTLNLIRQEADKDGVNSIDPWTPGVDNDYVESQERTRGISGVDHGYVEPQERMRAGGSVDGYEEPNKLIKMMMAGKPVRHVNVAVNQTQDNKGLLGEELTYAQSVDDVMKMTPAKKVVPVGFVNKATEKPSSSIVTPVVTPSRSKHIASVVLLFVLTIIASAGVTYLILKQWPRSTSGECLCSSFFFFFFSSLRILNKFFRPTRGLMTSCLGVQT